MDAYRLSLKLEFDPAAEIELGRLIPIFHRWIRDRQLDELAIDVADYRHVPDGPGVMLITHEAHYSVETIGGRTGLRYARKRPATGSFSARLRDAMTRILVAGQGLEAEPTLPGLAIPGDRWTLGIEDRLLAPNSDQTLAAVEPELVALGRDLYGESQFDLERLVEDGESFRVAVTGPRRRPGVETLLKRLSPALPPLAVEPAVGAGQLAV